jgi:flagellar hook assembly protein FlgD
VPNPFNPTTTIVFTLPGDGSPAQLVVYDVSGRHIRTLFAGTSDGAEHTIDWNGRNDAGEEVATGIYLVRLQAGSEAKSAKLVLVK